MVQSIKDGRFILKYRSFLRERIEKLHNKLLWLFGGFQRCFHKPENQGTNFMIMEIEKMSYINPVELIQVLRLHFEGTLDQILDISYVYRDVRDWYFDCQLRGLVDSEMLSDVLLSINSVHRQAILHYFTNSPESLDTIQHLYVQLTTGDVPDGSGYLNFDEWYGEVLYSALYEIERILLEEYL